MVYPPVARNPANRSSVEAFNYCQTQSTTPSILIHQQQLYSPFNPVQTCAQTNLTPQYIYTNTRRHPVSSAINLRGQDSLRNIRNTKWLPKPYGIRIKNPIAPHQQHPFPYAPPPLVLYDPLQSHMSPSPSIPLTPVYLNQATTSVRHNPYPIEPYLNFHNNLINQPYYKPAKVQTFCLIPDQSQNQFPRQQTIQKTYYNISRNDNLQNVKFGMHSGPIVYPTSREHEGKLVPVVSNQLLSSSYLKASTSKLNSCTSDQLPPKVHESMKHPDKIIPILKRRLPYTEKFVETNQSDLKSTSKAVPLTNVKSPRERKYLDDCSSCDFTIEAEKMVAALCNSSSDNLEINQIKNKKNNDIKTKNKTSLKDSNKKGKRDKNKTWYVEIDETKISTVSIGIQTLGGAYDSQYPELMRKTIHWGCNEGEKIINKLPIPSKKKWLIDLALGTRIACTKSSTCFPVYSGDEMFSQDLIEALLRISNGWLILDHYFNKQHQPPLTDKFDDTFIKLLKTWEISTYDLLQQVIKTFIQLGSNLNHDNRSRLNSPSTANNSSTLSFPGDVSLYVNFGLSGERLQTSQAPLLKPLNINHLASHKPPVDEEKQGTEKVHKLRTKWTITKSGSELQKHLSGKNGWNVFSKDPSAPQNCPLNSQPQHKMQYQLFPSNSAEKLNEKKQVPLYQLKHSQDTDAQEFSTINFSNLKSNFSANLGNTPMPSTDQPYWNYYKQSHLENNFPNNESNYNNFNNRMILLSQTETKRTEMQIAEGEAINLSTWFSGTQNKSSNTDNSKSSNWWESTNITLKTRDSSKNTGEQLASFKNDINRQIRTLKNMKIIQTAPWTANQPIPDKKAKNPKEEKDSSEDVRVYMKPGSYNVPKKKYPRHSQRRNGSKKRNASSKSSQNNVESEDKLSHRKRTVLSRHNISSSSSSTCSQEIQKDIAWNAARASAEILLDSLNITGLRSKELEFPINVQKEKESNDLKEEKDPEAENDQNIEEIHQNSVKKVTDDTPKASKLISLEASNKACQTRTNIKTDSWLIKTLNDASNRKENEDIDKTNQSSNKKLLNAIEEDKKDSSLLTQHPEDHKPEEFLEISHATPIMSLSDVGKATYSETVRRFSSSTKHSSKVFQKLDEQKLTDSSHLSNVTNSRKDVEITADSQETRSDKVEKIKKKKHLSDRSWSVWYSSRRRQNCNGLSPVALGNLVSIRRALWRMDVTRIFKCPSNSKAITGFSFSGSTTENCRKTVKSPIFLETIAYKLKNNVYRKAEHVIRDFRRIVHNSKLYYKNDKDCMGKIDAMSNKLEELLEKHFSDELNSKKLKSLSN